MRNAEFCLTETLTYFKFLLHISMRHIHPHVPTIICVVFPLLLPISFCIIYSTVRSLSSSQRAGPQPRLAPHLCLLSHCKDSCGWKEVIIVPKKSLPHPHSRIQQHVRSEGNRMLVEEIHSGRKTEDEAGMSSDV